MSIHKDVHLTRNMLLHYLAKFENPKMLLTLTLTDPRSGKFRGPGAQFNSDAVQYGPMRSDVVTCHTGMCRSERLTEG